MTLNLKFLKLLGQKRKKQCRLTEQFYLWFSPGGELERFTPSGEAIWMNNEEIHIDGLYSILSDLNQGKISIESLIIK